MANFDTQENWDVLGENWDSLSENWDSVTTFVLIPRGRSSRRFENYNFWLDKTQRELDDKKIRLIMTTPDNQEQLLTELKYRNKKARIILIEAKTIKEEQKIVRKLIVENIFMNEMRYTLNE